MGIAFQALNVNETEDHGFGAFPKRVECPACEDLSIAYSTAAAVFGYLGLEVSPEFGEIELPRLRRAIVAARARGGAERFERSALEEPGPPRAREDGSIELRPPRFFRAGLDADGILVRVAILERIVVAAQAAGATHLSWA
jgi:hypothetical protein